MKKLMGKLRRWSKRKDILIVPDDHLDVGPTAIGLMPAIENGEVACGVCGGAAEVGKTGTRNRKAPSLDGRGGFFHSGSGQN